MHYSITETVSWMLGGYDESVMLKDESKKPYQIGFGMGTNAKKFHLFDHIGVNTIPIGRRARMNQLDWEKIIMRIWPQELSFFHIDAPTRRRHCMAHYHSSTVSSDEYQYMALQAGLQDTKQAFADVQELGAWTMDLLWTEVLNRIGRVQAYTSHKEGRPKAQGEDQREPQRFHSRSTVAVHDAVQARW
eukprot:6171374-Amphidinium_carterae.6